MDLQNHLFSVSELNNIIKDVLESSFYSIKLEGEISNFRPASSGHLYFSLKDNNSSISIVMFRNVSLNLNFKPKDGMKVKLTGKLSIYTERGTYQIICNKMELFGEGDILLMLEERKRKFASLGYFDSALKKRIPRIPKTIGIVTSHTGAALQDILKVINRRHCLSDIVILPTLVQGNQAGDNIAKQINKANSLKICDLLIVARGGGSVEDLLPFSDEKVVIAIYNSTIPIISGVGHEIDTSISDLTADLRAATPSAAAEIATEGSEELYKNISKYQREMIQLITSKLSIVRKRLEFFQPNYANRVLQSSLDNYRIHIDSLKSNLSNNINHLIYDLKKRVEINKNNLENLSPLKLFEKGYSWVSFNNRSIKDQNVNVGDKLKIHYSNGIINSEVIDE